MSSDWITGGELLDAGIQVFELTNAIREERISCTDPVSGKPVLDVNTSRAVPKYSTLSQALIAYREGCRRTGMSTNVEQHFLAVEERRGTALALTAEEEREYLAVARQADENCARVVLKEAVTYPAGTHQFDFVCTNHRNDVEAFTQTIRKFLFPRAEAAACFPQWAGGRTSQAAAQPAPKVDVEGESTGRGKPTAEPNPESLITTLRENGVTDTKELAAEVDKHFPGLSYAKLGKLLPATSGAMVSYEGQKSQGQRLRGKK